MSVSINNIFNYSRPLPEPFDTITNKKDKVSSIYGDGTASTLCATVIKAVHAVCRCMNGSGEGAVGVIDHRSVAEYWLVEVQNEPLGHAIERLTPYRQEIILLYFFLGFKNKEIAALYGCNARKISYHKMRAVRQIRAEMEVRRHE